MCESLEYSDDRLAVITTEHACFASGTSLETSMTGSEKTELFHKRAALAEARLASGFCSSALTFTMTDRNTRDRWGPREPN
uniref:Uncharacterized protein n=1 Tax=Vespula pensylvanica TaxID=30213 RepID=A0A834KNF7_VESPE|nr:hypothetical protein H0235_013974 [Vespula pensylvanica]